MNDHIELELSDLEGLDLPEFDASEYLESDEAIAAYLNEALDSGDSSLMATALNDIARARGMTEIAKKSGLARESLYKALRRGSQPRMETITKVLQALNLRLVVEPIEKKAYTVKVHSYQIMRMGKGGRIGYSKALTGMALPAESAVAIGNTGGALSEQEDYYVSAGIRPLGG